MESVIATVSGYHGAERFNLIRLISQTGASYVGNMNQSVTHLVCWKFEGRKYELAKKFKISIVNHRWIEECAKKGRRVSEEPYTFQSGEETGPLCLDTPLGIHQAKAQSKALKTSKRPVIDIECEDVNNAAWSDSILFDEIKEASTSQLADTYKLKKRSLTSSGPHCKSRRLVKKHTGTTNTKVSPQNNNNNNIDNSVILSDSSDIEIHERASTRNAFEFSSFSSGQDNRNTRDDVEEIEYVNDEIQNDRVHGSPSSLLAASEDLLEAFVDFTEVDPSNKQPASSELSCVICWTDFSSTRGVLPCGHRFCFSCIQNWADHMASRRKASTCPLCKASFICITKVEDAVSSDQKIYSQSIPHDTSKMNLYILPDETCPLANPSAAVCSRCSSREPEDLLIKCHFCQIRCVHSYCLDPPLFPWTCVHCKDLQMLYLHSR
ncbi:hypothetical protein MIMGU_mgv1a027065mg [Erythranthe guttata]|uniref:RING-type E3 ubiquitin transferase BRCA1 n=1 Tax=Erythranthe guttata TaxID=4155 RepID=A0A022RW51_ERYGU|nr:hypothetical protein MIMGU_mgv1a027065mg [Erythranthe guttata]